jgi:catalase
MYIPLNNAAYSPNTFNSGSPRQANQSEGVGFFTAPGRTVSGSLLRATSSTFKDVWSQPRLFFNSLLPTEQQFLINAMRFETSKLTSDVVKQNVIFQLNRVSNDLARRVGAAIGVEAPPADPTYYNDKTTEFVSIFNNTLLKIDGLKIGILASTSVDVTSPIAQATTLKDALASLNVSGVIVAETLANGAADQTYSATDASQFDGVIIAEGTGSLFTRGVSPLFPEGRPAQILTDAYRWGKPVGALGNDSNATFMEARVMSGPGVYPSGDIEGMLQRFSEGLRTFKFLNRFPMDG